MNVEQELRIEIAALKARNAVLRRELAALLPQDIEFMPGDPVVHAGMYGGPEDGVVRCVDQDGNVTVDYERKTVKGVYSRKWFAEHPGMLRHKQDGGREVFDAAAYDMA